VVKRVDKVYENKTVQIRKAVVLSDDIKKLHSTHTHTQFFHLIIYTVRVPNIVKVKATP
jgi:hypothetical protein